ncbi:AAA family ATPase [Geodermatophilus ruber]|uniref:Nuclease SbcCD subunit C n=1 Tax=Geodermatophilus ruber TaxID=504800 RepID=A0A1I4H5M5_9ACTN|nr:AAA family ATPase [Geodermatophilus ruber]SFL37622.1 RecF/RecN/SMC N terminal domain-containing protein [Geodermatophilus ruber]
MSTSTGDDGLHERLSQRIDQSTLSEAAKLLVLSAFWGDEEFRAALDGAVHGDVAAVGTVEPADVPKTYLTAVTVTGFRGIGPQTTLALRPGPGLTLVVGRNGSGKSSFAEAAEIALTGTNARWRDRSSVWREGWRNLHRGGAQPSVEVELQVDGEPGATRVAREWDGEDVDVSRVWAQRHGARREYGELGWADALTAYRPFLSYSELGSVLGRPSDLYDALFRILGLQKVSDAQERLHRAFTDLENRRKECAAEGKELLAALRAADDDRALRAAEALGGQAPDLNVVADVLRGEQAPTGNSAVLRAWTDLIAPDPAAALRAAEELEAAAGAVQELSGGDSDQARRLVALLEQAVDHADHAASADCPVCSAPGRIDATWRAATEKQLARLRQEAEAADRAHAALRGARAALHPLAVSLPAVLREVAPPDIDGAALHARWTAWTAAIRTDDPATAIAALRDDTTALAELISAASAAAGAELRRRQDAWQPLAERLSAHLPRARDVSAQSQVRADVKSARDWLKGQADDLRDEGLRPIADQAADVWRQLRQESNVDLGPVRLEGTKTRRRVELDVTVDGDAGAALGVMSQGELHALGLALFLPRAMLDQSPFRFVVIDDPVQAMDPSKVDGLARVLAGAARTHQVVVFTHDDRLPDAVRRLQLPATIWEVVRRERSVVELMQSDHPVTRYLDDARAVARTESLNDAAKKRVVAGFCRSALEAACHDVVRRRRLGRGDRHSDVEGALVRATTLTAVTALALFDDAGRGGEVLARYNRRLGSWAGDVHQACNKGVHGGPAFDAVDLVEKTQKVADFLRAIDPNAATP